MVHQGEAIIPAGQNRGGGDTVLNFYGDIVANNPEERLQTNAAGSRVRIQKALKLKRRLDSLFQTRNARIHRRNGRPFDDPATQSRWCGRLT